MLVVLVYSPNICYTQVKKLSDVPEVTVVGDVWRFENKLYTIGTYRRCDYGCRYGPIIVVDASTIEGLNRLINASQEAVSSPHSDD